MLSYRIVGDRIVIGNLEAIVTDMPHALDRGLCRIAVGIERGAHKWLSGPGGLPAKKVIGSGGFTKRSGERVEWNLYSGSGGYPVPVRAGHLRRLLDWLRPGQTKTFEGDSYSTGQHEIMVYDSAKYSDIIHEGTGSSRKFGPRRFLTDSFEQFSQGAGLTQPIEDEVSEEIRKRGME